MSDTPRMPALFVAHGNPLLLDDARWVGELRAWAEKLPRPKGVVIVSAHWVEEKVSLGSAFEVDLTHDTVGLPKKYSEVKYRPPVAKDLRTRVHEILKAAEVPVGDSLIRGLDSGAYVPLMAMYPNADVPVTQISLPSTEMGPAIDLGKRLAPLRDEGALLVGSGSIVHNVRATSYKPNEPVPSWAKSFDAWIADVVTRRDVAALEKFRAKAKDSRMAAPTSEHLAPLAFALGASLDPAEPVTFPIVGFAYGSMSRRSVQFG